ncbi:MAG: D-tyrosyl-tRNA(Tyr) deacylase [Ruminococcus sp.]|nr:D-tyrosyl-tRNA(Tyr) deacylase [Ruminococcus sp.]MBQ9956389.1 D-tyrosyl-tRNA(Tyr) deacylase [Ruminococcus sp.]
MRVVLQRVTSASVTVDGNVCGKIGKGYLVLLGVGEGDTEADCRRLADKIINLRIFADENDKINLSLEQVGGELLVVSQFTLYADCRKGNRPNFIQAGKPDIAEKLYEYFAEYCRSKGKHVETGIFGADMKVELVNDGPFTVVLE